MLWHILRYLTAFIMPSFYKKIRGNNLHYIQDDGPVIIAMNHPNAFADPVLFTFVCYPVRVSYLARGDAFKPGLISKMLENIGIVPIFRIQDAGKEGLKKNDEAYRRVNHLLKKNGKMIVFAEGLCIQERRLRPLKKGVARMVFGAYDFLGNEKLRVVPVGVNYSDPDKFRSTVFFNVGKPLYIKDYMDSYKINPARANNLLLQDLEPRMKELITHINNPAYDRAVTNMEVLCKKDWLRVRGMDKNSVEHNYSVAKEITAIVNTAEIEHKHILDEFSERSTPYLNDLKKAGLRDWIIDPSNSKKVTPASVIGRLLIILATSPLYLTGLLANYIPYKITELVVKKVLKANIEFYASMILGVGMVITWLSYVAWFFLIKAISPNPLWPIFGCIIFALCGWFVMDFYFFILRTLGLLRAVKSPETLAAFRKKRKELLSLINKFTPKRP
jgi:1-acyl-sn-glycerol-3-phosphate acyltransferase